MSDTKKRKENVVRRDTQGCSTGKITFQTKRAAKAYRAQRLAGLGHMRPYDCRECGGIHLGHLPARVMKGDRTAGEVYGQG